MAGEKPYMNGDNLQYLLGKINTGFDRKSSYVSYALLATGWSSGQYSFESDYPSASYDITDILPAESATDAERRAWVNANCDGYYSTNVITAHGTVPTVDIPVVLILRNK